MTTYEVEDVEEKKNDLVVSCYDCHDIVQLELLHPNTERPIQIFHNNSIHDNLVSMMNFVY